MNALPPSGLGALLGLLTFAAFCAVWVIVAARRREVRRLTQRRNLERAVQREIARNQQPERVSL